MQLVALDEELAALFDDELTELFEEELDDELTELFEEELGDDCCEEELDDERSEEELDDDLDIEALDDERGAEDPAEDCDSVVLDAELFEEAALDSVCSDDELKEDTFEGAKLVDTTEDEPAELPTTEELTDEAFARELATVELDVELAMDAAAELNVEELTARVDAPAPPPHPTKPTALNAPRPPSRSALRRSRLIALWFFSELLSVVIVMPHK